MTNAETTESLRGLDIPQKCRDCPSLAEWVTTGLTLLDQVTNPNPKAVSAEINSLAQRCADPSEGNKCFAGDDMFAGIIESDIKTAASAAK